MSKRIALVIGHNAKAQGAVRVTDGRPEYDWNSDLARAIHACAPCPVHHLTPHGWHGRNLALL